MRISSYSIFLILILLFIGCDTKDILKLALEKQIEDLTQQNIDLTKLKNDLSVKADGLLEENKDLTQQNIDLTKLKNDLSVKADGLLEENKDLRKELETFKNRFVNASSIVK